ncbi:MAG: antitoxin [Chitinophagaceae bacterium]|nr:MAG: antitoxin [Chitinophagaceae bacterium]
MKTTLNLRFDKNTIEAAKKYASKRHTSLSEIVEGYLKKLVAQGKKKEFTSDELMGVLKEYQDHSDEEIKELYLKGKHPA